MHIELSIWQPINFLYIFLPFPGLRFHICMTLKLSEAVRRLIVRSREVSKLQDCVLKYPDCFDIWKQLGSIAAEPPVKFQSQ